MYHLKTIVRDMICWLIILLEIFAVINFCEHPCLKSSFMGIIFRQWWSKGVLTPKCLEIFVVIDSWTVRYSFYSKYNFHMYLLVTYLWHCNLVTRVRGCRFRLPLLLKIKRLVHFVGINYREWANNYDFADINFH